MEQLLLAGDVAKRLGVTPSTIRALVKAGRLVPSASSPRGVLMFSEPAVDNLERRRNRERYQQPT